MLVGVKYCGGCNPHYDRKKAVEKFKASVHVETLEPYRTNIEWDAVIVVCGCATACATVEVSGVKKVTINSLEDVDEAIHIIWRLLEAEFD